MPSKVSWNAADLLEIIFDDIVVLQMSNWLELLLLGMLKPACI